MAIVYAMAYNFIIHISIILTICEWFIHILFKILANDETVKR